MPIFKKIIFTGFSPNLNSRDTAKALAYLLFPWRWSNIKNGKFPELSEKKLCRYFNVKSAFLFDSGRSALYYALKALGACQGDEILVQAYTCVVVGNAIQRTGARPIYLDIGNDFNLDPVNLTSRITPRTKVLIIQHTFGLPANLDKILTIARQFKIKIIEDCAHSLGARYHGKLTGTFGDIGMFSFGSDKVISCVRGGALITNDENIGQNIKKIKEELPVPNLLKTIQHLMHYPVFFTAKPLYSIYLGKIILILAKKLHIINKIVYKKEKRGESVSFYPSKLPNSLADILNDQLDEIEKGREHRRVIAQIYNASINNVDIQLPWQKDIDITDCGCLRYPIITKKAKKLFSYAKKNGIILGNWYDQVIAPNDIDLEKTGYQRDCPKAELLARQSLNLPTDRHISPKIARHIVTIINSFTS